MIVEPAVSAVDRHQLPAAVGSAVDSAVLFSSVIYMFPYNCFKNFVKSLDAETSSLSIP